MSKIYKPGRGVGRPFFITCGQSQGHAHTCVEVDTALQNWRAETGVSLQDIIIRNDGEEGWSLEGRFSTLYDHEGDQAARARLLSLAESIARDLGQEYVYATFSWTYVLKAED